MAELGRTLFIVNPASKNGKGALAGDLIKRKFTGRIPFEIVYTENAGHAQRLAYEAPMFDTIISVGGDGTAHEVANGILERPEGTRPAFSLIPLGSGNDYCRALELPLSPEGACSALLDGRRTHIDCGKCNGEYFLESVSFGLDAAVAIGTFEMRKKNGGSGLPLYLKSGFNVIKNHFRTYETLMKGEDGIEHNVQTIAFSCTIGKTYGSGFKIAPDAKVNDGLLNICYADPVSVPKAALVFALASMGQHRHFSCIHMSTSPVMQVSFDEEPFAQFDGEARHDTHFDIEVCHHGIQVVMPKNASVFTAV